jgi:hypothetical protein
MVNFYQYLRACTTLIARTDVPVGASRGEERSLAGLEMTERGDSMIVRIWRGRAAADNADAYFRHVTGTVFPELVTLAGHKGAWLLRREADGQAEFLAVTFWKSLDSIRSFAGDDIATAIVEPEARAVLSGFDDFARHYELAFRMDRPA